MEINSLPIMYFILVNLNEVVFAKKELEKSPFQRVYQYLIKFKENKKSLDRFEYDNKVVERDFVDVLRVMIL